MKRLLVVLLIATGCRSAPSPAAAAVAPRPAPSALAALSRVLEAVDRFERPGVVLRLRAVESDSLRLHGPLRERVRVFLHLTAMAPDLESARRALEDLRVSLEPFGAVAPPPGTARPGLFLERDWTPAPVDGYSSFSDAVRIEVEPHDSGEERSRTLALGSASSAPVADFLDSVAQATGVEARAGRSRVQRTVDGRRELHCRVAPAGPDAHETLGAIGGFLEGVEEASPAARWIHLEIERALDIEEGLDPNGWTFEGELVVRER